jgi:serine/threonine protein kinase/tetratricopeptide (TPR) repeat protein
MGRMIGRTLSHYRIIEPLGAGGMGVVYRAHDLHLDRDVALKVLPEGLLEDDEARQRFRREALSLSRLKHAHINIAFDFDSEDGIDFLVMELVLGETLQQRLKAGALPESEVRRLGLQIAGALEAAHDAGVLHRDLKPGNIMLSERGDVKILDFGLAKRLTTGAQAGDTTMTALTTPETVLGTLAYMAPEQTLGKPLDVRSDLYSLGVVLFELATARRPFEDEQSFALASAILHQPPPSPRKFAPKLSRAIEAVILKCLAKEPAERYESAKALIHDLKAGAPTALGERRRNAALLFAGGAIAVAAMLALLFDVGGVRMRLSGSDRIRSLAVLPLANLSGDPSQMYFADGMTDELTTTLSQIGGFSVISRASSMRYRGSTKSVREIAHELGIQAVIEGSVMRVGNEVRISAELVEARHEHNLWAQTYQRNLADVLKLQSEVALTVAQQIRAQISPVVRTRLALTKPVDPAAHEAYLKGRFKANQDDKLSFSQSIVYFQQALAIDPTYAVAYAGLSSAYAGESSIWTPAAEAMPKAREAARHALELDPGLAAAHASLAYVLGFYDWRWSESEAEFKRAIELDPGEATAHQNYGYLLTVNRRFDEARREVNLAHDLDPLSPMSSYLRLFPIYEGRHYDEAIAESQKTIKDFPDFALPRLVLAQSLFMKGDRAGALRELNAGYGIDRNHNLLAWTGYVHAASGAREPALAALRELEAPNDSVYIQPYLLALVNVGLGEKDKALKWLERGVEARSEEVVFLNVDPAMDPLRTDPGYAELLKRVGFAP